MTTRSTIQATLIRGGMTRDAANREGGLYDPMDDPADYTPEPVLPYAPEFADFNEDLDDGRFDDDPNVYHGDYSEE